MALERFAAKHGLAFPLASDRSGGEGRVARIWRKVKVDGHAATVEAAARALRGLRRAAREEL